MRDRDQILLEKIYYSKILNEAIPLSIAKGSFTRKRLPQNYTKKLNKIFQGKDRIIIPFNKKISLEGVFYNREISAYRDVYEFFHNKQSIGGIRSEEMFHTWAKEKKGLDWEQLTKLYESDLDEVKQMEKEFYDYVYKNEYIFDSNDYIEGYVYKPQKDSNGNILFGKKDTKQKFKIGRILQKYGKEDLLKRFKEDPFRQTQEEYVIVVSRHPYDLAGMSTDRNWTSCVDNRYEPIVYKDKKEKEKRNYKKTSEMSERDKKTQYCDSGLIAYLVPKKELLKNEKIALHRPISRLNISNIGNIDDNMFGVQSEEFREAVTEWVNKNF